MATFLRRVLLIVAVQQWVSGQARASLYRWAGFHVGNNCVLLAGHRFSTTAVDGRIEFHDGCFVNKDCWFDPGTSTIVLEENVVLAAGVALQGSDHELGTSERRAVGQTSRPITIGRGSWVGVSAVVLGGVSVGPGCVIGAGAVVTKSTERDGVYAGVPARRARDLDLG